MYFFLIFCISHCKIDVLRRCNWTMVVDWTQQPSFSKEQLKYLIQTWVFGRHFLKNKVSETLQRKELTHLLAMIKLQSLIESYKFENHVFTCIHHCLHCKFLIFKDTSDEIDADINYSDIFISSGKIKEDLEGLQYFPNDQFYDITKLCMGNGLIPR